MCRTSAGTLLLACFLIGVARPAVGGGLSFVERELPGANADYVAVSPDGNNVYFPASNIHLRAFTRNPTMGALTFFQELEDNLSSGDDDGIGRGSGAAISADGRCMYLTSDFFDTLAVLSRDTMTGGLSIVEVKEEGVGGITGLEKPVDVLVSPDDLDVYVTGESDLGSGASYATIVVFGRTPPACTLTYKVTETGDADGLDRGDAGKIAISPDGDQVYATGTFLVDGTRRGSINVLNRFSSGHLNLVSRRIDGSSAENLAATVRGVVVSGDGKNVYAVSGSDNSIVVFERDAGVGSLGYLESHRDGGPVDGLADARDVLVSPDGAYVYVVGNDDSAVAVFRRDPVTGRLRFLEAAKDPYVDPPNYVLGGSSTAALSPAGDSLYVGGVVLAVDGCGNGNRGVDEQCDDGNVVDADGCSATCRLELCGAAPAVGCRGTVPLGALLKLKHGSEAKNDQLQWNWTRGDATMLADYGDPTTNATYALCIYDASASPQPLLVSAAPPDGVCKKGAPCWKAGNAGYKYKDSLLTPDGLQTVQLREGLVDGKAVLKFKGKGVNVLPPGLPLTLPVTVQVKNTATGTCWEAVYGTASTNGPDKFTAKSD